MRKANVQAYARTLLFANIKEFGVVAKSNTSLKILCANLSNYMYAPLAGIMCRPIQATTNSGQSQYTAEGCQ